MQRMTYVGILCTGAALFIFSFYSTEPTLTERDVSTPPQAEFGGVSLTIEYATTTLARELGLGNRKNVPENYGMLFVFPKDDLYGFWMKNTLISLDIFWLDDKGQVISIAQDVLPSSYPNVFYPNAPARYVLETRAGFARAHFIATSTPLLLKNFPTVSE